MNLSNFLLIDASSPVSIVVARLDSSGRSWGSFVEETSAALEGIFSASTRACPHLDAAGFLFCEGPGSILGIRIAAIAVRGRNALEKPIPVFSFQSLRLVATLIARAFPKEKNFVVLAESRMNAWNILRCQNGVPEADFHELKTAELNTLAEEKIFVLPQRRSQPPPVSNVPVNPTTLLRNDPAVFSDCPNLLHRCENPDATNTAPASGYTKWTPERHR